MVVLGILLESTVTVSVAIVDSTLIPSANMSKTKSKADPDIFSKSALSEAFYS